MADQDSQDRQLPASAKKLQKAREDGNVPRSRDLGHFAALMAGGMGIALMLPTLTGWLQRSLQRSLHFGVEAMREPKVMFEQLSLVTQSLLLVVVPMMIGMGCAGLGRCDICPPAVRSELPEVPRGEGAPGVEAEPQARGRVGSLQKVPRVRHLGEWNALAAHIFL